MLGTIWNHINSFEFDVPNSLTSKLPLIGKPWQVFIINAAYLLFVFKLGPAFMRNRPAYKLKNVLLVYNGLQVLLNLSIPICGYIMIVQQRAYDLRCMSVVPDEHPLKYIEVACFYLYYVVKFTDYLDTIFFVLRKSTRQITFLHVYHHLIMATCSYMYIRYIGVGGHIASMGLLNSIVHVFMYAYYFVAAFNPAVKSSLWWKKYITRLQITQFVIICLHNLYPLFLVPDCDTPRIILLFTFMQSSFMLYLFGSFYKKTYINSNKNSSTEIVKSD